MEVQVDLIREQEGRTGSAWEGGRCGPNNVHTCEQTMIKKIKKRKQKNRFNF
jgi:hypothetical protein